MHLTTHPARVLHQFQERTADELRNNRHLCWRHPRPRQDPSCGGTLWSAAFVRILRNVLRPELRDLPPERRHRLGCCLQVGVRRLVSVSDANRPVLSLTLVTTVVENSRPIRPPDQAMGCRVIDHLGPPIYILVGEVNSCLTWRLYRDIAYCVEYEEYEEREGRYRCSPCRKSTVRYGRALARRAGNRQRNRQA